MSITLTNMSGWLFYHDRFFIDAEGEHAAERIKDFPHLPAINKTALDLIEDLLHRSVTSEAKVETLKRAIQSL